MKITLANCYGKKKVKITFAGQIRNRNRNKTFDLSKIQQALDFACNLEDQYIDTFDENILNIAKKCNHEIIKVKYMLG